MPTKTTKRAELGGQGSDRAFEEAFSNVAHAYLADACPGLLDYEVGFQLIDRDGDEKAVGVFGFKVGTNWLYAPVFFVDGDLKGHELLYDKSADKFIPLKENWVNDLLAKKPGILGQGRRPDAKGARRPDLSSILQVPVKRASAAEAAGWAADAMTCLARHCVDLAARPQLLPGLLAAGGPKIAAALSSMLAVHPTLRAKFADCYDPARIRSAVEAGARPRAALRKSASRPAAGASKVDVYRLGDRLPVDVDLADREALLRGVVLIKDAREDREAAELLPGDLRAEVATILDNPTRTGLHEVLEHPGTYRRCLVIMSPHAPGAPDRCCLVVALGEGKKSWIAVDAARVWVRQRGFDEAKGTEAFDEFIGGLPEAGGLAVGGGPVVLIAANGRATMPFKVLRTAGAKSYEVAFEDRAALPGRGYGPGVDSNFGRRPARRDAADPRSPGEGRRVHLGSRPGASIRILGGDLYAPEDCRVLKLSPGRDEEGWDAGWSRAEIRDDLRTGGEAIAVVDKSHDSGDDDAAPGRSVGEAPIDLGDPTVVELGLLQSGRLRRVHLKHAGGSVAVDGVVVPAKEAAARLVLGYGLREADALTALAAAEAAGRQGHDITVKRADDSGRRGPYLTGGGASAPPMDDAEYGDDGGGRVRSTVPQESNRPVEGLPPEAEDPDFEHDPTMLGMADKADGPGQRDTFDAAVVGSLLKGTRDDMLIDRHVSPMADALDHVGRLIFGFYWHRQQFVDRFGESDLNELEDSLRNNFESLGDLVLFLRQKSVEASPAEAASDVDLGDSADA